MSKEIYLYYPIYDFVAQAVISDLNDNMGKPCTMRVCSPGGHVRPGLGIFAKIKEHGNVNVKVDGAADSMASFIPMYAKTSECLNVSRFVFHRADMLVENDEDQAFIDGVNNDLRMQMKARIKGDKWKNITGVTIDEMFDETKRNDYVITGPQAVEIGLCDTLKMLTPAMSQEIEAINKKFYQVAAKSEPIKQANMTLTELQEKHPELYKEVQANMKKEISAKEKDRVGAWMVFHDVDPEAVKKGIEAGEEMTNTQMAEFTKKLVSGKHLTNISAENAGAVKTAEQETAEKNKESQEAEAAFDKELEALIKSKKF